MAANYDDVRAQLEAFGLRFKELLIGAHPKDCHTHVDSSIWKTDGPAHKPGWYALHEITLDNNDKAIIGGFGVWQGAENNAQKIKLNNIELTTEQKKAFRQRIADDIKVADAYQKRRAEKAANEAQKKWSALKPDGDCDYLERKCIGRHGIRFSSEGAFAIPMIDTSGRIHGLQFYLDKEKQKARIAKLGRDRQNWPPGVVKKAHFHMVGSPTNLILLSEGYATFSSLLEATGHPSAMAFDANNLESVARSLKKHYPKALILICADDDAFSHCKHCEKPVRINLSTICPHCNQPHGKKNAGKIGAELAALAVNGHIVFPKFADEESRFSHYCRNQGKLSDFNDLHVTESLHTVRLQIESTLLQLGWAANAKAREPAKQGGGEGEKEPLKPIDCYDHAIERYALVYGMGGMLFDSQEHMRVGLNDFKQACINSEISKRWQESKSRRIVRAEEVGFDPTGKDKTITCNIWDGFPSIPKEGSCDRLLELLMYMCAEEEENSVAVFKWVLNWLAYPLQNPGAKMQTTIVIHGPQGTGKNLFFDVILGLYGKYGCIIGQSAIEDKFNDTFAGKLFVLANEVVARSDLYHVKNTLKGLITDRTIRINPKNMAAYQETNQANIVFLSNERMPVALEQDDRRHQVIWTPTKLRSDFYREVANEIDNGGGAALHHYLVNLDLGDFNTHTNPLMTRAKKDLQDLSKDSIIRFYDEWINKEIPGIIPRPALSEDVYFFYTLWCRREGVKSAAKNKVIDAIAKRPGVRKERKRYMTGIVMIEHPKSIIIPANSEEMTPGNSESGWLGKHIVEFRDSVDEYIEGSRAYRSKGDTSRGNHD